MSEPDDLRSDVAYWQYMAISPRPRLWWHGWTGRAIWMGDDEWRRRTLVLGPLVVALWACRCKECRTLRRTLRDEALA